MSIKQKAIFTLKFLFAHHKIINMYWFESRTKCAQEEGINMENVECQNEVVGRKAPGKEDVLSKMPTIDIQSVYKEKYRDIKYIIAAEEDTQKVVDLVQNTICLIYPRYYPIEVVSFFLNHHNEKNIREDIRNMHVWVITVDDKVVGTGSYINNHITRVYVSPNYQKNGFGNFIMQDLEDRIFNNYDNVTLDSSLPASMLYEKRGYRTMKHCQCSVENDAVLVYEIMKKQVDLHKAT